MLKIYVYCYWAYRVISLLFFLFLYFITHPSDWFASRSPKPATPAPTCLIDPVYGQHKYIEINGIQLHYVISGPEGAPLMLLLHGFMEFWYSWRFQIREFSKQYRVVALDLPGYGYSDKPTSGKFYTILSLTNCIIDFVNAIGRNKCILVGQSLGASISWNVVRTRPDLFTHLIIINGPDVSRINFSNLSPKTQKNFWYMFVFRLKYIPEYMTRCRQFHFIRYLFRSRNNGLQNRENFSKEDMDAHLSIFNQENALTAVFNYYRYSKFGSNASNRSKITINTLVLWSTLDEVLTKELAEESTSILEHYELKYLDCSHWVQQDIPREVNSFIHDFLKP